MAFWAVEVVPGKAFSVVPPFDLHLTQIVLPAAAHDKGRSVLEAKLDDKSFAVASLKLDLQESSQVDLIFEATKPIVFSVSGKNPVQLLGYFLGDEHGHDDFSDDDMDGIPFDEEIDSDDEDDEDSDDLDDDEEIDEAALSAATLKGLQQKRKGEQPQGNGAKKAKVEQAAPQQKAQQQPKQAAKGEQKAQQPKAAQTPQQPKGQQKAQTPQPQKGEQKPQTPTGQQKQQGGQQKESEQTKTVQGVRIETKNIGLGAAAQVGRKVYVMYSGRLENGKVFDKSARPFGFTLGAGEVIAGWDIGVAGMRVGEKRKLTIPSNKGYGARGAPPDIPKHATLIFDVELIKA